MYVSMVDAGTVELVRSFGVEVVPSGDLVGRFESTWDDDQWAMHQAAAPMFGRTLKALSEILGKAQAEVDAGRVSEAELLDARLAPDMFPLVRQVQIATDMCKGGLARLAGQEPPAWVDEEKSLAELRKRLARTVDFIQGVPASAVDGSEARAIHLSFRGGEIKMEFTGQDYLLHFVVPNFYFHATTAYDILRHRGVTLAKADFIGAA